MGIPQSNLMGMAPLVMTKPLIYRQNPSPRNAFGIAKTPSFDLT